MPGGPGDGEDHLPATDDYFNVYDRHPGHRGGVRGLSAAHGAGGHCSGQGGGPHEIPQVAHVGWDMAITPTGPAIIEGNDYPGTDLCQLAPFLSGEGGLWPYYKEAAALVRVVCKEKES